MTKCENYFVVVVVVVVTVASCYVLHVLNVKTSLAFTKMRCVVEVRKTASHMIDRIIRDSQNVVL